jgi:DNA-binding HxlR family transcriptional regulator
MKITNNEYAVLKLLKKQPERINFNKIAIKGKFLSCNLGFTLKRLAKKGLVLRTVRQKPPIRVYYCITAKGRKLAAILEQITEV